MKRTSKTTTNTVDTKAHAKAKRELPEIADETTYNEEDSMLSLPTSIQDGKKKYLFTLVAVLIIAGIAAYKFQYIFTPAKVGNQPIFVWQYINFMHRTYGKEALQTLTTQALINEEIARSNVTVKPEDIQKEVDGLDKQASASGGIKAMLAAQQMTIDQLKDQIRIQLAVKQILKDKIAVSDAEVDDAYKKNRDFFKGVPESEARSRVKAQLENQKFQKEAGVWLSDVRKRTPVQILFPGLQ